MANQTQVFDPTEWNSIQEMISTINTIGHMIDGKTEDGEIIIFDVGTCEDHDILKTTTLQSNGWVRENEYDPTDYTICESYHK